MKTLQKLALGAAVLAFAASASAQTVIRIVASNGDRVATQTAISNILSSSAGGPSGTGWAFRGTSGVVTSTAGALSIATGANFGAWNGRYGGIDYVIKVSYSGALAGIQAVAATPVGSLQARFVVTDGTGAGSVPNPLTGTTLGVDYELGTADFGFSTNFQATSPYNGTYLGQEYAGLTEEVVGVSPLGFYGSPGFPGSPSSSNPTYVPNITTQLAQLLYTTGSVRLAQFTGDFASDENKIVYAIGRNTDAGQRYGAYGEIGLGTTSSVAVWFPTVTGATTTGGIKSGGTVTGHVLWPVATQPGGIPVFNAGEGGYSSGALLAEALTVTLSAAAYKGTYFDPELPGNVDLYPAATAGYYIGYLTPGDANPRVLNSTGNVPFGNRGVALSFNGVPLTDANVKNGAYTAWVYNRILKRSSLAGTTLTLANAIRDRIKNFDATTSGLFDDANFKVQRFTDGGLVIPK